MTSLRNAMGDCFLRISRLFLNEEGKGLDPRKSSSHADPAKSHGGNLQLRSTMDIGGIAYLL